MGIGVLLNLGKAGIGLFTANPVLVCEGLFGAGKSYLLGEALSPITEPIQEAVGEIATEIDWVEITEMCPF